MSNISWDDVVIGDMSGNERSELRDFRVEQGSVFFEAMDTFCSTEEDQMVVVFKFNEPDRMRRLVETLDRAYREAFRNDAV